MSWYLDEGKDCDVVLSSRIRLARNLQNYKFPHLLKETETKEVSQLIKDVVLRESISNQFMQMQLNDLSSIDRLSLMEKNLISKAMLRSDHTQDLLISKDESLSIMINEEDHLRIQAMSAGSGFTDIYQKAIELAKYIEYNLPIAKDEQFGYLTACPTNTGTGLRASVMVHLPGLSTLGYLRQAVDALIKSGFTVRGSFGEGSDSKGQIYQISNNVTLGISDFEIIRRLQVIIDAVIKQERHARNLLLKQNKLKLENDVFRAWGILQNARLMDSQEAEHLLSVLRLGIALNILTEVDYKQLNQARYSIGPATVQKIFGEVLTGQKRDARRAEIIRKILSTKSK